MTEGPDGSSVDLGGDTMASEMVQIAGEIGGVQLQDDTVGCRDAVSGVAPLEENDSGFFCHRGDVPLDGGVTAEGSGAPDPVLGPGMASEEQHSNDASPARASSDPSSPGLETFPASNDGGHTIVTAETDRREAVPSGNGSVPLNLVPSISQTETLADESELTVYARDPSEYSAQTSTPTRSSAEPQTPTELEVHTDQATGGEEVTSMEPSEQEVTPLATAAPQKEEGKVNRGEDNPGEGPVEGIQSVNQDEPDEEEDEEDQEGFQEVSPRCSSQSSVETPPSGSQKKSANGDSCTKYNTVSYRKIRKGNTKQRIDEFESMMNS
ncbi:ermin-like [Megalops cyprinoides]|uniref:ermin-like n=1 Tax=Megalops cyprinoides TaxID=118141 RepID=UPI001864D412|nr:ermin-like [Megalops cyprinoides]